MDCIPASDDIWSMREMSRCLCDSSLDIRLMEYFDGQSNGFYSSFLRSKNKYNITSTKKYGIRVHKFRSSHLPLTYGCVYIAFIRYIRYSYRSISRFREIFIFGSEQHSFGWRLKSLISANISLICRSYKLNYTPIQLAHLGCKFDERLN